MVQILKSKLNNLTVTKANLLYEGSITLPSTIINKARLIEYEQVHVLNLNNGERIVTYVINGGDVTGDICMNGPSAHKFSVGDRIIVLSYRIVDEDFRFYGRPIKLFFDEDNNLKETKF